MLVITALVGTRDLGQEVYIALTRADVGAGPRRRRLHRHARDDRRPHDDRRRRPHPRPPRARRMTGPDEFRVHGLHALCMRCACPFSRRPADDPPRTRRHPPDLDRPVTPEPLAGGITNLNFTVTDAGRRYLVRIGGDIPEHMILRRFERAAAPRRPRRRPRPRRPPRRGGRARPRLHRRPHPHRRGRPRPREPRPPRRPRPPLPPEIPRHYRGPAPIFWVFQVLRDYAHTLARRPPRPRPPPRRRRDASKRPPARSRSSSATTTCCPPTSSTTATASGSSTGNTPASTPRSSTSAASPPTPA